MHAFSAGSACRFPTRSTSRGRRTMAQLSEPARATLDSPLKSRLPVIRHRDRLDLRVGRRERLEAVAPTPPPDILSSAYQDEEYTSAFDFSTPGARIASFGPFYHSTQPNESSRRTVLHSRLVAVSSTSCSRCSSMRRRSSANVTSCSACGGNWSSMRSLLRVQRPRCASGLAIRNRLVDTSPMFRAEATALPAR